MFKTKKRIQNELRELNHKLDLINRSTQDNAANILQANILLKLNENNTDKILNNIHLAEFKVFSQWKDDGIIQFLVNYLEIESKTFIEFGVQDYTESNTRFLLINNNWTGLIMDGTEDNIQNIKKQDIYWKYNLSAVTAFITGENINGLIEQNGFTGEIGLLHIDIDGNDYWVWKEISIISPIVVIVEYNSVFGKDNAWTVPYKPYFYRTDEHYSNLYFGSSLQSLCDLAKEKGYLFIGCNSNGNNAYFVRNDKIKGIKPLDHNDGFVLSQFRESRDKEGNLTFIGGGDRLKQLKGMEIYNTRTNTTEYI